MIQIRQTEAFTTWLHDLRDRQGKGIILRRLARLELGHFGDAKPVGQGVTELRIDHGPGYRIYLTQRGQELIILLCAGDKSSQDRDIRRAIALKDQI